MQNRWLLKAHPEAFVGMASYESILSEDMNRFRDTDSYTSNKPLLAVGEITDVSNHSRPKAAQVLAAATGKSGELLRLVYMDDSQWNWGDDKESTLNLSVVDVRDREDEVIWESDGLPISQIKFATSLSTSGLIRWLIIQKQTSTMILRPEYHGVPVADAEHSEWPRQQRPSRIEPNMVLSISHKQTGGNAHSDVAFYPPLRGQPPQIAIIDECGYWSVWDIPGTLQTGKNTLRVSLNKTGHILEGLMSGIPKKSLYAAEPHGILFVGSPTPNGNITAHKIEEGSEAPEIPGPHLLMWNHEHFRVLDLQLSMLLPKLPSFHTKRASTDWILDVQLNPNNHDQIFVLTSENIFWVSITNSDGRARMLSKPSILTSCSHPRGGDRNLKMTVCPAESADSTTTLVFVNSPNSTQLAVYWFSLSSDIRLPQWHRHVTEVRVNGISPSEDAIQTFAFQPAELAIAPSKSDLDQNRKTRFFQGNILTQDLAVRYCICSAVIPSMAELTLPSKRINWSKADQEKRRKKKRKRFLEQMTEAFALPVGFTDVDINALVQLGRETTAVQKPLVEHSSQPRGPVLVEFSRVYSVLQQHLRNAADTGGVGLPVSLVHSIKNTIREGLDNGKLSLLTW